MSVSSVDRIGLGNVSFSRPSYFGRFFFIDFFPYNEEEVDLAAWSADESSPSRRPRRPRAAAPQAAERPNLPPADQERVASLLAELTRETCQLFPFFEKNPFCGHKADP